MNITCTRVQTESFWITPGNWRHQQGWGPRLFWGLWDLLNLQSLKDFNQRHSMLLQQLCGEGPEWGVRPVGRQLEYPSLTLKLTSDQKERGLVPG